MLLARLRCGHMRITLATSSIVLGHLYAPRVMCASQSEHILISCPALNQARRCLTTYVRSHNLALNLRSVLGDGDPTLTDLVLDFVSKTYDNKL